MTKKISIEEMMESGMHFGHQAHRRNPKMDAYIFGVKSGISIIDLTKTEPLLEKALKFVSETVANGKQVILVGTKRQASNLIKENAEKCDMPYVNERWLGGLLTNYDTINKRVEYLKKLDEKFKNDDFDGMTKKEKVGLDKVHKSLATSLGGLRNLRGIPGAVFIVDIIKDSIAVREARKMGVPIVAIVDTNVNPDMVDYIIPGNDDARKAIEYVLELVADACNTKVKVEPASTETNSDKSASDEPASTKVNSGKDSDKEEKKEDKAKEEKPLAASRDRGQAKTKVAKNKEEDKK